MSLRDHRQRNRQPSLRNTSNSFSKGDDRKTGQQEESFDSAKGLHTSLKEGDTRPVGYELSILLREEARKNSTPPQERADRITTAILSATTKQQTDVTVSQALFHLAKIKKEAPSVTLKPENLNKILKAWRLSTRFDLPRPRELFTVVYAANRLGVKNEKFYSLVEEQVKRSLSVLNNRDLCSFMSMLSTEESCSEEIFEILHSHIEERLAELSGSDLTYYLLGIYNSHLPVEPIFRQFESQFLEYTKEIDASQLALLFNAYIRSDLGSSPLIAKMVDRIEQVAHEATADEVSLIMERLGETRLNFNHRFPNVRAQALALVPDMKASQLSQCFQGLRGINVRDTPLLSALTKHVLSHKDTLAAEEIAHIGTAAGFLAYKDKPLIDMLFTRAMAEASEMKTRDIAQFAYGMSFFSAERTAEFLQSCDYSLYDSDANATITQMLYHAEVICLDRTPGTAPPALQDSWAREVPGRINSFEESVGLALAQVLLAHPQYQFKTGELIEGVEVDFLIIDSDSDKRWCIECDGVKYHRFVDGTASGRDMIQDKLFQKLGIDVLHIYSDRWQEEKAVTRAEALRKEIRLKGWPFAD